ncbi:MAG: protease [Phycisphaerae bacterium]|nr:protease [Phycisphaerae bacterium]
MLTQRVSCVAALAAALVHPFISGCAAQSAPTPVAGPIEAAPAMPPNGYYRQPAIHGDLLVFVAEGDLWKASVKGGVATRLTSHPGDEGSPAISPDGSMVAFTAQYEGPTEVYVMPVSGGLPTRLTWDGSRSDVSGWTPGGRVVAATERFSTLPNWQLTTIDPKSGDRSLIGLAQAADGCFDDRGTLYFTRLAFQGSSTKRYKGGTAQQLWRFAPGAGEATPLSKDFDGTSKRSMWWDGRVYFVSDRDGTMNVWSMKPDASDLKQHTTHAGFDVQGGSLSGGRIAYQVGADVWVLDLASGRSAAVALTLDTDLDQMRERWVEKPMDYLTSAHASANGDRVVMVARGRVFVAPHRQGRLVDVARDDGVRYRAARFMPDGKSIVALSDKTGEIELWRLPANGVGEPEPLTSDGVVLRWDALPSPDGTLIAHHDKNLELWIYDVEKKTSTRIDRSEIEEFSDLAWSPDGRWLAYTGWAANSFKVVKLFGVESGAVTTVTTDRYDSYSPAWGGQWLYFLSDRTLRTVVPAPWGPNQPDPFLDQTTGLYALALKPGQKWPFAPATELDAPKKEEKKPEPQKEEPTPEAAPGAGQPEAKKDEPKKDEPKKDEKPRVEIDLEGIAERLFGVPIPAGNYSGLSAAEKALFFVSTPSGFDREGDLRAVEIKNEHVEAKTVLAGIGSYELTEDGKKLLVRRRDTFYIVEASASAPSDLEKKAVDLSGWSLSVVPRRQWRQMFIDSWRLMRDYFYDKDMHGVNWRAMLDKYLPLVDRVTTRAELSDLMAQMVGELSALHIFVRGGDRRIAPDNIPVAALGGELVRDAEAGGYRVARIYRSEPDDPGRVSPLARPDVGVREGDVITTIDGVATLSGPDLSAHLRKKADRQVLIRVKPRAGDGWGAERDAIVTPITQGSERDLRYTDWEYTRRQEVERRGEGKIGYLHLRAMGGGNYAEWVKGFYPVFNRDGLILDVRHNSGGNIDSWLLSKLMRKAWFYWSPRVGNPPSWNMQYAFRGHMVVLCNERTASDGEAFAEGFRRLGLGKVIGTRTWGGEIWLSSSNVLVDKGIASAAEFGVYGPEGEWLIEGWGVVPDIVVDNPPHATFKGEDAQLEAAVAHLKALIKEKPIPPVVPPKKPDLSFENK